MLTFRIVVQAGIHCHAMGCHRGKLAASTDPKYESQIQVALADIANDMHKNKAIQ
jgi:hypothetical protein